MIQKINSEKAGFIVYVRKVLEAMGLSCYSDGRAIPGEMVLKLRDEALVRNDKRVKFKSERLNSISKGYGLSSLDQLFKDGNSHDLKGLYRLTFRRKDLDMAAVLKEYEADETCVFAAPNFMLDYSRARSNEKPIISRGRMP